MPAPVATIQLSIGNTTVEQGQTITFTATALDITGKKVGCSRFTIFSNSDPTVVNAQIFNKTIAIEGLKAGTSTIIIACGSVHSVPIVITVGTVALASIALQPLNLNMLVGESKILTFTGTSNFGAQMPVASPFGISSDVSKVTFGAFSPTSVIVNAIAPGSVTVKIKSGSVTSNDVNLTVTGVVNPPPPPPPPPVPTTIILNPLSASVVVGFTQQFTAKVFDQSGNLMPSATVAWSGSDNTIGTVSSVGLVSGISAGNFSIIARSGNASSSAQIVVSSIVVDPPPPPPPPPPPNRPLVGAIRFDDWSPTDNADFGSQINLLLTTPGYDTTRWPYYTNGAVPSVDEGVQSVTERDILLSRAAGIDFWIFQSQCTKMLYAHANYVASPNKNLLKFCKMETNLGDCRKAMTLDWMNDSQYLTFNGRPVVFFAMFFITGSATPADLVAYRQQIIAAGHPNPYFVGMDVSASAAIADMVSWDLDAISGYAWGTNALVTGSNLYSSQVANEETEWLQVKTSGLKLVPPVTAGYDNRFNGGSLFTTDPTPTEIANHLKNALDFVSLNKITVPSNMVVISAWNEFVENHFVCPKYINGNANGDTSRLDAIGNITNNYVAPTSSPPPPPRRCTGTQQVDNTVLGPRTFINTSRANTPSTGNTINLHSGDSLNGAIAAANRGDKIIVDRGVVFPEVVTIPDKGADGGFITIQPSGTILNEGVRATENVANAQNFPTIMGPNLAGSALVAEHPNATKVRFINFKVQMNPSCTSVDSIIKIGSGLDTSAATLPSNIIFDGCAVLSRDDLWCHHAAHINAKLISFIDGCIKRAHADIDSQAIYGYNGCGPYKFVNNELSANTEVMAFGGADPPSKLIATDVEFRRNWCYRPLNYIGNPAFAPRKNIIEPKCMQYTLFEGNVLEGGDVNAQDGSGSVTWVVNQNGTFVEAETKHITYQKNIIRNCSTFARMGGTQNQTIGFHHISYNNNIGIGMNQWPIKGDVGMMIAAPVPFSFIEHNTWFQPFGTSCFLFAYSPNSKFLNNLTGGGAYPIFMLGGVLWPQADDGTMLLDYNVVAGGAERFSAFQIPLRNNKTPADFASIGLNDINAINDPTLDINALALRDDSPYHCAGSDNTDIGADIDAIKAATLDVRLVD